MKFIRNINKVCVLLIMFTAGMFVFLNIGHYVNYLKERALIEDRLRAAQQEQERKYLELEKLADIIRMRIDHLQNPTDCNTTSKILCDVKRCGLGCQVHHVTHCLLASFATQRTLILNSSTLRYSIDGWESIFQPLSETCKLKLDFVPAGIDETKTVFKLPDVFSIKHEIRPNYLPWDISKELANRIRRFHGNPAAWWIGQFVRYVTRPNQMMRKQAGGKIKELGFEGPIVGVHVRRTDKLKKEAEFHAVEEYMIHVENWFNEYEILHHVVRRRVYLATDEPTVLNETKTKYPGYTIISNSEATYLAHDKKQTRFTEESLRGIYVDIHLLSLCDYVVCTFSSNICRAVYELMQTRHGDASTWVTSIDKPYAFNGLDPGYLKAMNSYSENYPDSRRNMINISDYHLNLYTFREINETKETIQATLRR